MSLPRPPPFSTSTQAAAAATGKVCAGVSPAAVVAAIAAPVAAVACAIGFAAAPLLFIVSHFRWSTSCSDWEKATQQRQGPKSIGN